jgi:hypothetical protein
MGLIGTVSISLTQGSPAFSPAQLVEEPFQRRLQKRRSFMGLMIGKTERKKLQFTRDVFSSEHIAFMMNLASFTLSTC